MQIVPAIADRVVNCSSSSAPRSGLAPFEKFQQPIDEDTRYLLRTFPIYGRGTSSSFTGSLADRSGLPAEGPRVPIRSARSIRGTTVTASSSRKYIRGRAWRPDGPCRKSSCPPIPPTASGILLDNGWYQALRKPSVTLVTSGRVGPPPPGVVTASGDPYDVDVLGLGNRVPGLAVRVLPGSGGPRRRNAA